MQHDAELEDGLLGGIGKTVEVDETKIGRRKYHRGRVVDGVWIWLLKVGSMSRKQKRC